MRTTKMRLPTPTLAERTEYTMTTDNLKVVEFPVSHAQDIPAQLRALADEIESGDAGPVAQLAYVLDGVKDSIQVGLMGQSDSSGAEAYLLLAAGQKHILGGIL